MLRPALPVAIPTPFSQETASQDTSTARCFCVVLAEPERDRVYERESSKRVPVHEGGAADGPNESNSWWDVDGDVYTARSL